MASCGISAVIGGFFKFLFGAFHYSFTYMNSFWDEVRIGAGVDENSPILKC